MTRLVRNESTSIESPAGSGFYPQAEPDEKTLDILTSAHGAIGVISGCTLSLSSPVDEYIQVAAGVVQVQATVASVSAAAVKVLGTAPGSAADGTNPRITLILADNAGALSQVHGTAASPPEWPDYDETAYAVLGAVLVHPSVTTIAQVGGVDPFDSTGIILRNGMIGGTAALTNILTPASIADVDDYAPTGYTTETNVLRISATTVTRTISGLTGGSRGRVLLIHNVGSVPFVLSDENALSTAANRFDLNADVTVASDEGVFLWYDTSNSRWRVLQHMARHGIRENGTLQTDRNFINFIDTDAGTGLITDDGTETEINLNLYILKSLLTTRGDIIRRNATIPERYALGLAAQYLRSDGTDIAYANPIVKGELTNLASGADKWVYRMSRATGTTFTTLEITCDTAPGTESHIFTFRKNGTSLGTVTLATSSTRNTSTVTAFGFAAGDKLSVDHDGHTHTTDEGGRITAAIY
jgi:hypothetical protein